MIATIFPIAPLVKRVFAPAAAAVTPKPTEEIKMWRVHLKMAQGWAASANHWREIGETAARMHLRSLETLAKQNTEERLAWAADEWQLALRWMEREGL